MRTARRRPFHSLRCEQTTLNSAETPTSSSLQTTAGQTPSIAATNPPIGEKTTSKMATNGPSTLPQQQCKAPQQSATAYLDRAATDPSLQPNASISEHGPVSRTTAAAPNLILHNLKRVQAGLSGEHLGRDLTVAKQNPGEEYLDIAAGVVPNTQEQEQDEGNDLEMNDAQFETEAEAFAEQEAGIDKEERKRKKKERRMAEKKNKAKAKANVEVEVEEDSE
ncbi:hypothetical protein N7499_012771 [Penicillium canescens]|nr:hypothetical protein N7499_012771 [Penicillium canescens]